MSRGIDSGASRTPSCMTLTTRIVPLNLVLALGIAGAAGTGGCEEDEDENRDLHVPRTPQ